MNLSEKQAKAIAKFLLKFMSFNRKQQLEIINKLERKGKNNDK